MLRHASLRCARGFASRAAAAASSGGGGTLFREKNYTAKLNIDIQDARTDVRPTFQVLDLEGNLRPEAEPKRWAKEVSDETLLKMHEVMVRTYNIDKIFNDAQRQGRISFYMPAFGEYATHVGSAAALKDEDIVYMQYREQGVLIWRGMEVQYMADQCVGNVDDPGKGRQMPVHYGSREMNVHTVSSPLATQISQAAGAAYALELRGKLDACSVVYFGEGAASEGDFHAALNFAATLNCPTLFFCRNNRWAISTPSSEQYLGDGMVSRGPGYGMATVRFDGNDAIATYAATVEARALALRERRPVLLEAMTYRVGNHSTSDDSSRYRSKDEIEGWSRENNPITRLRRQLDERKLWDDARDKELHETTRRSAIDALSAAEKKPFRPVDDLFSDVYDELPWHLREQRDEVRAAQGEGK